MRRRKQIRLKEYDYSRPGAYFVTICSKDRIEMFGEIVDGEMIMNQHGNIVQSCWDELPLHYPNIQLDEFIVMPNHVHGIIIIVDERVGSRHASTLLRPSDHTLGNIVGSFKSAVTKRINENRRTTGMNVWQRNYYDHIIRNERSLNRIREYIRTNPERWPRDKQNMMCKAKDPSHQWLHDRRTNIRHIIAKISQTKDPPHPSTTHPGSE